MIRASLIGVLALLGAARPSLAGDQTPAQALDAYTSCWSNVVRSTSLDGTGAALEAAAAHLARKADKVCGPESDTAARLNSLDDVKEARRYMEVQFYNSTLR